MHSEYQMKTEMFWNKFCFCNDFISSNIRSWCVLHLINRRTFLLCCSYLKVKYVKHLATCSKKGSSSFCHEVSSCKKEASDDRWTLNTVNGCKMLCKRNESGCLRLKCITRPQKRVNNDVTNVCMRMCVDFQLLHHLVHLKTYWQQHWLHM